MSKVVFVGNVPYNMGEDQLIDVFKSVGQVVGFRLVFDRETGKPRGYGFCEFADHDTALSAVRNLNGTDVGGRPLRIDLADSDPFLEGKTTVRGELVDSGDSNKSGWRDREYDSGPRDPSNFLSALPPGVPIPPGQNALDAISRTLATMDQAQLMEVLAQMKAFIITHQEEAKALLVAHPQLAYTLFQALLLNNIVDPAILQRMMNQTSGPPAAPPPVPSYAQPPPIQQPQPLMAHPSMMSQTSPPPQSTVFSQPPPQQPSAQPAYYRQPPPPQAPPAQSALPGADLGMDPSQQQMLYHVLKLTPEQISVLPPSEREAIQTLRSQFGIPA